MANKATEKGTEIMAGNTSDRPKEKYDRTRADYLAGLEERPGDRTSGNRQDIPKSASPEEPCRPRHASTTGKAPRVTPPAPRAPSHSPAAAAGSRLPPARPGSHQIAGARLPVNGAGREARPRSRSHTSGSE